MTKLSELLTSLKKRLGSVTLDKPRVHLDHFFRDPRGEDEWPLETSIYLKTKFKTVRTVDSYRDFVKNYPDANRELCNQIKNLYEQHDNVSIRVYPLAS